MADVAVVTDTTHYLPPALLAEAGVHEVSLYVNEGGRAEREAGLDFAAFYDRLRTAARAADDLPAVHRRLPRRLRPAARGAGATSSRSTSRARSRGPSTPPARRPRTRSPATRGGAWRSWTPSRPAAAWARSSWAPPPSPTRGVPEPGAAPVRLRVAEADQRGPAVRAEGHGPRRPVMPAGPSAELRRPGVPRARPPPVRAHRRDRTTAGAEGRRLRSRPDPSRRGRGPGSARVWAGGLRRRLQADRYAGPPALGIALGRIGARLRASRSVAPVNVLPLASVGPWSTARPSGAGPPPAWPG